MLLGSTFDVCGYPLLVLIFGSHSFDDNGLRFLTGCVEFRDHPSLGGGKVDYGSIVFVEEWTEDQSEAQARLSRLIAG